MNPSSPGSLNAALLTALSFVLMLVVVVFIARVKKIPLPFAPPRPTVIMMWVAIFVVVAFIEELVASTLLDGDPAPSWDAMTPARAVRAATIVLLAPLAEEVAFRGTMFRNFR